MQEEVPIYGIKDHTCTKSQSSSRFYKHPIKATLALEFFQDLNFRSGIVKVGKPSQSTFEFFSGKQKYSIGNMWVGETMRKDKIEPTLTFSCSTISVYLLKIRVGTHCCVECLPILYEIPLLLSFKGTYLVNS